MLKTKKKKFDFLTKLIRGSFFFMLVVFHLTNNPAAFCHSYIAAEVHFQFMKKKKSSDSGSLRNVEPFFGQLPLDFVGQPSGPGV